MSSENNSSTKICQFGLHKGVDAKTQEFLKSSRRRQIRRGCICAAVAAALTVVIVVTMILIFEYFIAVDRKSTQRNSSENIEGNRKTSNSSNGKTFAEKLDSADFGFDQASFERMPLLVNGLQEKNYVDTESGNNTWNSKKSRKLSSPRDELIYPNLNIRKTSPHPFNLEYEAPTPTPFFNTQGWLETYRHAQRLKNLEKIIKYLENTMNAKFGDLHVRTLSSNKGMDGKGIEPVQSEIKSEVVKVTTFSPKLSQETIKILEALTDNTFQSDLLYGFKPDRPGDVNSLAETSFHSSSTYPADSNNVNKSSNKLMFKPIPDIRRGCLGLVCSQHHDTIEKSVFNILNDVNDENKLKRMTSIIPKSFSVMFDLYSTESKIDKNNVGELYITTFRPKLQFKRKSSSKTTPTVNHRVTQSESPKVYEARKHKNIIKYIPTSSQTRENENDYVKINGHLRANIYSKANAVIQNVTSKMNKLESNVATINNDSLENFKKSPGANTFTSKPREININSFRRPYDTSSPSVYDPSLISFEITSETPVLPSTNSREVLKFSHEDAKTYDSYEDLDSVEIVTIPKYSGTVINEKTSQANREVNSTVLETSIGSTYAPMINGHYRSVNQNSKTINKWINEKTDLEPTRNFEVVDPPCLRRPQYVEIRRINRKKTDEDETE